VAMSSAWPEPAPVALLDPSTRPVPHMGGVVEIRGHRGPEQQPVAAGVLAADQVRCVPHLGHVAKLQRVYVAVRHLAAPSVVPRRTAARRGLLT
jgi:hypothetical protein